MEERILGYKNIREKRSRIFTPPLEKVKSRDVEAKKFGALKDIFKKCFENGKWEDESISQGDIFNNQAAYSIDKLLSLNYPFSIFHSPFSIQYIPITDVQPGDYVLPLNEETGQIESHRINGLLDMGVELVFKLTTEKDGWRKIVELVVGKEIAVPKLGMFMLGSTYHTVMDKHYKDYYTEHSDDTQHNNHFSSPLSIARIKNKMIKDTNIAQKIIFCSDNSLAKNSPAKYPASMIFAKSPTSCAIFSLDFRLSHFIYTIKHIIEIIACQAGILESKAYAADTADVGICERED